MYILNGGSGAARVTEFPLHDGIASSKPDAVLNLPPYATSLALAPNGELAVFYPYGGRANNGVIDFYARGSIDRARPSGTLQVPGGTYAIGSVGYDANANIYALTTAGLSVYAPGSVGTAAPIATLAKAGCCSGLVAGSTYYAINGNEIDAYADVKTTPSLIQKYCLPAASQFRIVSSDSAIQPLAVDMARGQLFVEQAVGVDRSRIAIFPLNGAACPKQTVSKIVPTVNGKPMRLRIPVRLYRFGSSIAESGGALFVSDIADFGAPHFVYEFSARAGTQAPKAAMGVPDAPISIVVGP